MLVVEVEAECRMLFSSNYCLVRLKSKQFWNSNFQFQIYSVLLIRELPLV